MPTDRDWATQFAVQLLASFARVAETSVDHVKARLGAPRSHARGAALRAANGSAVLIVRGWACRSRMQPDGGRQIFGLVLPGDIIGLPIDRRPPEICEVIALTPGLTIEASITTAGDLAGDELLLRAITLAQRAAEDQLFAQILRLGRLSAADAAEDLLREIGERLSRVGLSHDGRFDLPLSQKILSVMLGISGVHLNRSLAELRAGRRLDGGPGWMHLPGRPARIDNR